MLIPTYNSCTPTAKVQSERQVNPLFSLVIIWYPVLAFLKRC